MSLQWFRLSWTNISSRYHNSNRSCDNDITNWKRGTCSDQEFTLEIPSFLGNINEDLAFEYGDGTTAYDGCGATLNNEFWYFGGQAKRQVKLQI